MTKGRFDDLTGRHVFAKVDDLIAVVAQHETDEVLADVVDVALDGGDDDRRHVTFPRFFFDEGF